MMARYSRPCVQKRVTAAVVGSSLVKAAGNRAELPIWTLCSGYQPCREGQPAHQDPHGLPASGSGLPGRHLAVSSRTRAWPHDGPPTSISISHCSEIQGFHWLLVYVEAGLSWNAVFLFYSVHIPPPFPLSPHTPFLGIM